MGNHLVRPSNHRRRLLIGTAVFVIIAILFWIWWPRIDPRFVGTWTDGEYWMVVRKDGYADAFFGRYRKLREGPKAFLIDRDGKTKEAGGVFHMQGRIRIHTSENHFQVTLPCFQTDTISGLLKYLAALLKCEPIETIAFEGTIVTLNSETMALEFEPKPGSLPVVNGEPIPTCSVECHRIADVPFGRSRSRPIR